MYVVKQVMVFISGLCCFLQVSDAFAQTKPLKALPVNQLEEAQKYAAAGNYDSAIIIYRNLYEVSG